MIIAPEKVGTSLQFFEISLDDIPPPQDIDGYCIRKARLADFAASILGKKPTLSLSRHLRRGDEYFLALQQRRLAAHGRICHADLEGMTLEEGEVFLVSFLTEPADRGKGLYVALMVAMMHELKRRKGFEKCIIWADRNNAASQRGIEKAGFRPMRVCNVDGDSDG